MLAFALTLKSLRSSLPAISITTGALLYVLPLFFLTWWIFDGALPVTLPVRALSSIVYLGVFGSVIGFILYFYVLKHVEINRIVLITLITPALALILGQLFNNEQVGWEIWCGTAMILSGLLLYQWDSIGLRLLSSNLLSRNKKMKRYKKISPLNKRA